MDSPQNTNQSLPTLNGGRHLIVRADDWNALTERLSVIEEKLSGLTNAVNDYIAQDSEDQKALHDTLKLHDERISKLAAALVEVYKDKV